MQNKLWRHLLPLIAFIPCVGYAYDHQVGGIYVGMIRAYGNTAGVQAFSRVDNQTFPGCTNEPGVMWADSAYTTADGRKALLAVLLSAKAQNVPVRIYYTTADGYCRFQIIDIE
jgi:hypothetical protein